MPFARLVTTWPNYRLYPRNGKPMKIAIIGTGIAGNYAAYRLSRNHDITVFESKQRIGGHTNTLEIDNGGRKLAIDTGFIVYNDVTYPNFLSLLDELGVESQPSDMSFSVTGGRSGLEYNGSSLNRLFAQRSNLFRPSFYRMIADILRFNREAPALIDQPDFKLSLGEYLDQSGYSEQFIDSYILPMGSAIWSATSERLRGLRAVFFVLFFMNVCMVSVNDRAQWRFIRGGSARFLV